MIEKEDCFGARELGGKDAQQPVSAPEVQHLVTLFYADLRKQREGTSVQVARREQGWGGLISELDALDGSHDQGAFPPAGRQHNA